MEPVVKRLGIDVTVEKPSMLRQWSAHRISEMIQSSNSGLSIMKRRGYVHTNGIDGSSAKRPSLGVIRHVGSALRSTPAIRSSVINHGPVKNGRSKVPGVRGGYKMHMISWIDAPDDVFFIATDATRKLRHKVAQRSVKRAARNPWRGLLLRLPMPTIEIVRPDLPEEVVMLD